MMPEDYTIYVPDDQLEAYAAALQDANGAAEHLQPSGQNAIIREQVEIQIKYEGYIRRQLRDVEQFRKLESKKLPSDINYEEIASLRLEARQKLSRIRPLNFGQASRISGVSPADVTALMIYVEMMEKNKL